MSERDFLPGPVGLVAGGACCFFPSFRDERQRMLGNVMVACVRLGWSDFVRAPSRREEATGRRLDRRARAIFES